MSVETSPVPVLPASAVTASRAACSQVQSRLTVAAHTLLTIFLALAFLTPSWRQGPFTWWPLLTANLAGRPAQIGLLALLPLLAALLRVAAWMVRPARRDQCRSLAGRDAWPVLLPVIGLGALTLLRLRPAVAPGVALIILAGIGFFWLLTFWLAQAPAAQVMRWLSLLFALVVLGQSTVGVVQFVRQDSAHLTFLGEPALDPRVEATSVVGPEGQHRLRAYGLTAHPNVLGGLLSIGLLWIMAGWLAGVPWPRVSPAISTVLWLVIGAVGLMGLLVSFSRAAWLGFGVGAAWLFWRQRRAWLRSRWLLLGMLIGVIFFVWRQPDLLWTRFFDLTSPLEARSISERVSGLIAAAGLIRDQWLLGVGSGLYAMTLVPGASPPVVHNAPLLAAAELGVGGGLLWLWLNGAWLVGLRRGHAAQGSAALALFDAVSACWLALFVCGLFDNYPWLTSSWRAAMLLGLLAGALIASLRAATPGNGDQDPQSNMRSAAKS
ncbi:O-antigen ligase family protein [Candidatus Amarolinea dominans]|uniref:O-antigen ligase family protein n=1 Tax=Candidatus Amarolinea dominans TaxID=3140696 RepID=UPI003135D628|nr:O-antigen ligase family protein [Anaerolineae bacterium]